MSAVLLVVDDEPLLLLDLADQLQSAGYTVVEAQSADAAKAILEARSDVAVVCTDVRMPGQLDGLGLTRWIKANRPGLPVIIASGGVTGRDVPPIGDARLSKPIDPDRLLKTVAELLKETK